MRYIFYPPPMPQSTVPPRVKTPIPAPAPTPDNPPGVNDEIQYVILAQWQPGPPYKGNLQQVKIPLIPVDLTGNNPPFRRENTIDRINLSWYTPFIYYKPLPYIAPFTRNPDNPIPGILGYPQTIYDQYASLVSLWPSFYSRLTKTTIFSPTITTPPIIPSFQVNVNVYAVRHGMDIEVNNNRDIQSVNQGSTVTLTIKATARRSFPRSVNNADAVVLSIKDSTETIAVPTSVATKLGDVFTFTHQLDTNAPKGPWRIQVVASYQNLIRVTPYSVVFTVI